MLAPGIILPCCRLCCTVAILTVLFLRPTAYAQQKSYRVYTSDDGLVSNHIQSVFQDEDGFLWFATFNGISIYDGHHFVSHTAENGGLTDNIVFGFFQKSKDEVWVIESEVTDVFFKRTRVGSIPIKGYELSNYINSKDGRTLASRDKRIYSIREKRPEHVADFAYHFKNIFEIGNYFLVQSDSLMIVNKSFDTVLSVTPGRMFKDRLSRIWVLDRKFYLLDTVELKKGSFRLLPAPIILTKFKESPDNIHDFLADADGFYWFFLENKGVLRLDPEGNQASFNFTRQYLDQISFTEDAEGNVWVPGKGGVIKFFNKHVDVYSSDRGLTSDFVTSVAEDNRAGSVWAANRKGICCIYQDSIYNFPYPTNYFSWTTIAIQHDSLWLCLDKLFLYKITYEPHPRLTLLKKWSPGIVPYVMMTCLRQDKKGSMLVTIDDDGLYRLSMNGKIQKVKDDIWTFFIDGDDLWTGTKLNGAARWKMFYEGDSLRLQKIKGYVQLNDDHVRSIMKDRSGNLWMARLKKGMAEFIPRDSDSFAIRHFNFKNGLTNGWVMKTLLLDDGSIYCGTLGGLFAIQCKSDSVYFENLSSKYGINTEVYDVTGSSPDNLWLASDIGIVHLRNKLYSPARPPKVFFTKMLLNNEPDSSLFFPNRTSVYSYKENNLSFEFSATSFRNENQVLYSYRLDKWHKESQWSVPGKLHTVSLVSLSPGSYTLHVKAITADNVQSDSPAKFSFVINEPFWTTWWFRAATLILLFSALFGFYRFRLEQVRRVLRVRTKISRDLHDEIGSTLSGIGLMSELVKAQLNAGKYGDARQSIEKISVGSEEILGKIGDIVWAINPQNDTFEKMIMRLKVYATNVAAPLNISIRFEANGELNKINLNMQQRNNIYLICKEAINNSVKYSGCSQLQFTLRQFDHSFQIDVEDDGKGFDVTHQSDGNGLKNMVSRAQEINAALKIISEKSVGTSVKLSFKIT